MEFNVSYYAIVSTGIHSTVLSQTVARNFDSNLLSLITDKIYLEMSASFPNAATRCST